jgi:hypothetical protein
MIKEARKKSIKDNNLNDDNVLDLTDIDEFAYSAMVRKLRQKASKEEVMLFLTMFKKEFDKAVKNKINKPDKIALQNTVVKFNKKVKIKLPKKMVKNAALTELGDSATVGSYLANIVKFTLNRISPENRSKALENVKKKLYLLDEMDIGNKNLPASAAMGQAITFVKHVLFRHDPHYVREVINHLVRNL